MAVLFNSTEFSQFSTRSFFNVYDPVLIEIYTKSW